MSSTQTSSETTMVGHLLQSGWKLHLSAGGDHAIYKTTKSGSVTKVDSLKVSADCVLELQQSGRLQKQRQFTVGHKKTTVFEWDNRPARQP